MSAKKCYYTSEQQKKVSVCEQSYATKFYLCFYSSRVEFYTNLMTSEYYQKCYFNLMVIFLLCLPNLHFLATLIALLHTLSHYFKQVHYLFYLKSIIFLFQLKKNLETVLLMVMIYYLIYFN